MSTVLARMGGALTRHRSSIMSRVRLERGGLPAQLLDHRRERLGVHPVLAQSDEDGEALLVQAAVQELGEFYRINGQRAGMTNEFAGRILGHLTEAEKALPEKPQKKSLLGL